MCTMTDQQVRYDLIAEGYATWWSPVHRAATLRLLDEIADEVPGMGTGAASTAGDPGPVRVLDVGCGTGALSVAAAERWPAVTVDGIDSSDGMLAIARAHLVERPAAVRERVRYGQAWADRLPFDDGSFDVVVSAFVLQLVPSAPRALREMRRVLRPGGRLASVRWLRGGEPMAADTVYDDALVAAGLEPRDPGGGHADPASPAAAAAQLRRAGFRGATARATHLEHAFTPEGFVGFMTRFDDEDLFRTMQPAERAALEADLLRRLRALPGEGLRLVMPIVYASGRRL
jgi:SAM-dependent methyltransferase